MIKRVYSNTGFTLVETLVVVALVSFLITATYATFLSGQSIWTRTNNTIELDENLNRAGSRLSSELKLTGHDAKGQFQFHSSSQMGINESDIIRFSIPVICEPNGNAVDANGDTAHWGAPLTWGCLKPSCMDQDNNCDTVEYKYIQYLVNEKRQLLRRVLDFSENTIKEEIVAENIFSLKAEPNFDQRLIKLTLTAQKETGHKQHISQTMEFNIRLRNAR